MENTLSTTAYSIVAAAGDRLHGGGVQPAVDDEALVAVYA